MKSLGKIVLILKGGLGNQLFSYAAAKRLAVVNNLDLVIDTQSGFSGDKLYKRNFQLDHFFTQYRKATFLESLRPMRRLRRWLIIFFNKNKPLNKRSYIIQNNMKFDPRFLQLAPNRMLYLEGYWQSENYFKDIELIIRNEFRIKPPLDQLNQDVANAMRNVAAVAIHVRFFDEPNNIQGNNTAKEFYQCAIEEIEKRISMAHYFIFSDRPDAALDLISLPSHRLTVVKHNQGDDMAFADLWLMTQCSHFIIANSTFSWWGAWLAENSGKIVIAPSFEKHDGKSAWGFYGLLPNDWIKL